MGILSSLPSHCLASSHLSTHPSCCPSIWHTPELPVIYSWLFLYTFGNRVKADLTLRLHLIISSEKCPKSHKSKQFPGLNCCAGTTVAIQQHFLLVCELTVQVQDSLRSHWIMLEPGVRSYEVFCRPYETNCVVLDRCCDVWSTSRNVVLSVWVLECTCSVRSFTLTALCFSPMLLERGPGL